MPSKKQRRRRQKERRHEFEEAYFDAEGNEISREEYEALAEETGAGPTSNGTGAATAATRPIQRGGRTIHPPSWRRVVKRGLLFAPLMYATLYVLGRGDATMTPVRIAFSTATLLVFFIPFSYFVDTFMYRRFASQSGGRTKRR
jgi:hypothetical protein